MAFRTHEEEDALDIMSLDDFLIENKEATFMLRAKSDSMNESGILRGDLVLIDRSKIPKANDIVIAVVNGAFVMDHFDSIGGAETKVEAVVTAVIRKYK